MSINVTPAMQVKYKNNVEMELQQQNSAGGKRQQQQLLLPSALDCSRRSNGCGSRPMNAGDRESWRKNAGDKDTVRSSGHATMAIIGIPRNIT